jgi:hypothetical protein
MAREYRQNAEARTRDERHFANQRDLLERDQQFDRQQTSERQRHERDVIGREEALQRERWGREDRRSIEENANTQIAALAQRITEVQDSQRKGEFLDPAAEADAMAEIEEAMDQIRSVRARAYRALGEAGDRRYKDMSLRDILLTAGYSREEIADQMRTMTAEESAPPAASTGSAATLGPPDERFGPPESPAPLRDMSQAGRGRRVPNLISGATSEDFAAAGTGLKNLFFDVARIPRRSEPPKYRTAGGF